MVPFSDFSIYFFIRNKDDEWFADLHTRTFQRSHFNGAEMLSLHLNKKDFEKISQTEPDDSDSSPKTIWLETNLSTWMIRRQLSWTIQTYKAAAEIQNFETNIV